MTGPALHPLLRDLRRCGMPIPRPSSSEYIHISYESRAIVDHPMRSRGPPFRIPSWQVECGWGLGVGVEGVAISDTHLMFGIHDSNNVVLGVYV